MLENVPHVTLSEVLSGQAPLSGVWGGQGDVGLDTRLRVDVPKPELAIVESPEPLDSGKLSTCLLHGP